METLDERPAAIRCSRCGREADEFTYYKGKPMCLACYLRMVRRLGDEEDEEENGGRRRRRGRRRRGGEKGGGRR